MSQKLLYLVTNSRQIQLEGENLGTQLPFF